MPDNTLSDAIKEAYHASPSSKVVVDTLELYHPDFDGEGEFAGDTIRLVRDFSDFSGTLESTAPRDASTEVTFTAYALDFVPPSSGSDPSPSISIIIDNASADIIRLMDKVAQSTTPIEVIYRQWLSDDTSAPQNDPPLSMEISRVSATVDKVTATATIFNFKNAPFPRKKWTTAISPSLADTPT